MPFAVFCIIYSLWIIGIFGDNIAMTYVIFISFCCPTALVILIITQIHGFGNEEAAWLMLWVYIFSLPTLVLSTYCFFLVF